MLRILLVVFACALSACRADITYRVLLIGDSIENNALPAISQKLLTSDEAGFAMISNTIGGTSFAHLENGSQYWLDRGAALLTNGNFEAVVVSLGINDATLNADPAKRVSIADMTTAAARFLARYGMGRPIFWILPHSRSTNSQRKDVVTAIMAASSPYTVHWLDIEAEASSRGIIFSTLLQPDGIHFNDQGNLLIADIIHIALAADAHARGLD